MGHRSVLPRCQHRDPQLDSVQRVRDLETLNPKGERKFLPYPHSSGNPVKEETGRVQESVGMEDSKQTVAPRHSSPDACMNSRRLWWHTQALPDGVPAVGRGSGHNLPPTPTGNHLAKEELVFSNGVSLDIQTILKGRPHTNYRRPTQNELTGIMGAFLSLLLCLGIEKTTTTKPCWSLAYLLRFLLLCVVFLDFFFFE